MSIQKQSFVEAIKHYEAALKEAFPRGATGDVFEHWNKARIAIARAESTLEAAVAEQHEKQEPVAWMQDSIELYVQDRPSEYYKIPLYTHPYASQPKHSDCSRSHPHENMDEMCELRTEIARLTNELAQLKEKNT